MEEFVDEICLARYKAAEEAGTYLSKALDIGQYMLQSGGEVSRVEDSIRRLCKAFGAEQTDVLTITSCIIVTITAPSFGAITQTRRVTEQKLDLRRLESLNALSRRICSQGLSPEGITQALEDIRATPSYRFGIQVITYALCSSSFCLFFGGSVGDALASALIGVALKWIEGLIRRTEANALLSALLCSFLGGLLAAASVRLGLGAHRDLINIGNVMLLIPGLALTTSLRDMFSGNPISGMLRFLEAVILALVIALGFALGASVLA